MEQKLGAIITKALETTDRLWYIEHKEGHLL